MRRQLDIIDFSVLTISQQHNEIHHLVDKRKSEQLSDALMSIAMILMEIEDEYNNKPEYRGNILEGHVLSDSKSKKTDP